MNFARQLIQTRGNPAGRARVVRNARRRSSLGGRGG